MIGDRVSLLYGDLRDTMSIQNVVANAKPDYVFHLAAQSFPRTSFDAPLDKKNKSGQTALDSLYGVTVIQRTLVTRDAMAKILRDAMVAKGLPVPSEVPADTGKQ